MLRYVWRELVRNPRRTLASLVGVALGVGLFSGVLFFVDGSSATMTARAISPLALDMQVVLTSPLGRGLRFEERVSAPGALRPGQDVTFTLTVVNDGAEPANDVVVNDEPPPPLSYVHDTTTSNDAALPDRSGQIPLAQGLARSGLNVGTLLPQQRITLTYVARATRRVSRVGPLALPVSGVVDLARANPLFSSRKSSKLEDFLYVPDAIIVSPSTFRSRVVPAFRAASAARGSLVRNVPVSEVDVLVDRSRLHADPARA